MGIKKEIAARTIMINILKAMGVKFELEGMYHSVGIVSNAYKKRIINKLMTLKLKEDKKDLLYTVKKNNVAVWLEKFDNAKLIITVQDII